MAIEIQESKFFTCLLFSISCKRNTRNW